MNFRQMWAQLTGRQDGPVKKCPVCGDFFDKDNGVKPALSRETTCSSDCAAEHDRIWAW